MRKRLMKLCLGIISGRIVYLETDDYLDLGYDPYRFKELGYPIEYELKSKAEDKLIELMEEK